VIGHIGPVPVEEFAPWITAGGLTFASFLVTVVRRRLTPRSGSPGKHLEKIS
jgi:hypothetical protein